MLRPTRTGPVSASANDNGLGIRRSISSSLHHPEIPCLITGKMMPLWDKYMLRNFVLNLREFLFWILSSRYDKIKIKKARIIIFFLSIIINYTFLSVCSYFITNILFCEEYEQKWQRENDRYKNTWQLLGSFEVNPFSGWLKPTRQKYRARRQDHPYETRASWHLGHLVGPNLLSGDREGRVSGSGWTVLYRAWNIPIL